jgi:hypothetical protein
MAEAERQRKERWDKGQPRYTQRDIRLMGFTGQQAIVRFDQFQVLMSRDPLGPTKEEGWVTESAVRRCWERWKLGGIAKYGSLVVGEPAWIWLTPKGLRLAGLEYRRWEPNLGRLRHLRMVNEARLWIEGRQKGGVWTSERDLYAARQGEGKRTSYDHMPDGTWETAKGQLVAIEVELSRKEENRLRGILYDLERNYGTVWYFTTPLIFTRLRKTLLGMKDEGVGYRALNQGLKEKLQVLVWDEEAKEWVFKGNGVKVCEEPPDV